MLIDLTPKSLILNFPIGVARRKESAKAVPLPIVRGFLAMTLLFNNVFRAGNEVVSCLFFFVFFFFFSETKPKCNTKIRVSDQLRRNILFLISVAF